MAVRLLKPYNGQAANTLFFGTEEESLRASGNADDQIELASDYAEKQRIVTTATASTSRNARVYNMNSSSVQTLTIGQSGYWPIGTVLTVVQWGTAKTTIVGGTGVTIVAGNGNTTLVTGGQNYAAQLIKTGAATWLAIGGLSG